MGLRIWSNEGERIVHLVDVDETMSEQDLWHRLDDDLTEEEAEITGDVPFESCVVGGENDPFDGRACGVPEVDMTYDEYVLDLKTWAAQFSEE